MVSTKLQNFKNKFFENTVDLIGMNITATVYTFNIQFFCGPKCFLVREISFESVVNTFFSTSSFKKEENNFDVLIYTERQN